MLSSLRGKVRAVLRKVDEHPHLALSALMGTVFVIFMLANIKMTGPQYLTDEVGYLAKASTLSGSVVHAASSWYGGYPILISPAFFLSANPFVEWYGVLVINALLWAATSALLYFILRRLYPTTKASTIIIVTGASLLYPSWMAMSGYAFATTGFVFIFIAALAALIKSELKYTRWLGLTALLSGYLYWIHPMGAVFVGLIAIFFAAKAIVAKRISYAAYGLAAIAMAGIYQVVVKPWFDRVMSAGGGTIDTHYSSIGDSISKVLFTPHTLMIVLLLVFGMVLYLCIATFGIIIYGSAPYIKNLLSLRGWREMLNNPMAAVVNLTILSIIGVVIIVAISSASASQLRADQWIYGRYSEMYLLPLLGVGLMSTWRARTALLVTGVTLLGGVLFAVYVNSSNTFLTYINQVNLQSFWPLIVLRHTEANYLIWFVIGALGIFIVGFLGTTTRKFALLALFPVVVLMAVVNYGWHRGLLLSYSKPSGLYEAVVATYKPHTCIGYTTDPDPDERLKLYSFYLHQYDLRPMAFDQWLHSSCDGPYLTFAITPDIQTNAKVVGEESIPQLKGLYMVTKLNDLFAANALTTADFHTNSSLTCTVNSCP